MSDRSPRGSLGTVALLVMALGGCGIQSLPDHYARAQDQYLEPPQLQPVETRRVQAVQEESLRQVAELINSAIAAAEARNGPGAIAALQSARQQLGGTDQAGAAELRQAIDQAIGALESRQPAEPRLEVDRLVGKLGELTRQAADEAA